MSFINDLDKLEHLQEIYEMLSSGKHLDATYNSELWACIQGERKDDYAYLFKKLGMTLRIDPRNFAYFDFDETNQQSSRRILLLFILLFKLKSDEGINLAKFQDWELDDPFFENLRIKNTEILEGEGIDEKDWFKTVRKVVSLGFLRENKGMYYLLPATWRFLDLFRELTQNESESVIPDSLGDDDVDENQEEDEDA